MNKKFKMIQYLIPLIINSIHQLRGMLPNFTFLTCDQIYSVYTLISYPSCIFLLSFYHSRWKKPRYFLDCSLVYQLCEFFHIYQGAGPWVSLTVWGGGYDNWSPHSLHVKILNIVTPPSSCLFFLNFFSLDNL